VKYLLKILKKIEKELENQNDLFLLGFDFSLASYWASISPWQFLQRSTRAFFVQNFGPKNYKAVFWV